MTLRPVRLVLSLAFALTGVGTALLGATLPATLHEWQLTDSRGGLLLLAAWSGATGGAFLARATSGYTAAIGLALSAGSLWTLSLRHPPALLAFFLLYGLGLGMTMTTVSLLRSHEVASSAVNVELNRLNLLWAAGACLSPVLALRSLHLLSVSSLFRVVSAIFALLAVATFATAGSSQSQSTSPASGKSSSRTALSLAPLRFGLFAAASVGLESAIGGWLTTYAQRTSTGVSTAVSANSAFWAGLLLSRAAHSFHAVPWIHSRLARIGHLASATLALALLILWPRPLLLPLAGFLGGFGLGPLYPYVLSLSLPRFRSTSIFVLAGVGSSVVPWLTGALSSASGNLRFGLIAPLATLVLLLSVAFRMRRELN